MQNKMAAVEKIYAKSPRGGFSIQNGGRHGGDKYTVKTGKRQAANEA